MKRYYYSDQIPNFCKANPSDIIGLIIVNAEFSVEKSQSDSWLKQIEILQSVLPGYNGYIYFEYSIPRMGRRIDVVIIIDNVIIVVEFKVGEKEFLSSAIDQVWDYALDLKNFHQTSQAHLIAPVLIATKAKELSIAISTSLHNDGVLFPIRCGNGMIGDVIEQILNFADGSTIDGAAWGDGRYSPTPTIIEAAMALYNHHSVTDIYRKDASAVNLSVTSEAVSSIIQDAKINHKKVICFVTGVPGAGKTLVGLNIATRHFKKDENETSIFLSGNGPLVAILREALTRDKLKREKAAGKKIKKGEVLSEVKLFIQNVHHFRDECLIDVNHPPFDHIAIFDEAQRAWNHDQTEQFMRRKKNVPDFSFSEPEFLISCLDRHKDWAVIICLVGGGQEINTGEAGIIEWVNSLNRSFPDWHVYISNKLYDSEYAAGDALQKLNSRNNFFTNDNFHLSVSMRSFRAEHLSALVKNILDKNKAAAKENYQSLNGRFPVVLTRSLNTAKNWLKSMARGNERYGIVVSSQAQRLKPYAIDVKSPMDPVHWFLDGKEDVRSSYYLEDVATEFHVQGLELDWTCVTWDADFRSESDSWGYYSFVGHKWNHIRKPERQVYLKNAYRVLLTRARQGMIIVVPAGDSEDPTRLPAFYNATFEYLKCLGLPEI